MPRPLYTSIWSGLYHESIVEHDPRLRSICSNTPWIIIDSIDVDWEAAENDDSITSHPIAIYLNKLALKSQRFRKKHKDLIYKRPKKIASNKAAYNYYDHKIRRTDTLGIALCSSVAINPRNRWFKLYERNPRFQSTTSTLSTKLYMIIQARSQFPESVPAGTTTRGFLIPLDKYLKCFKVPIYHRQTWNHLEEGGSFPSVWKQPDPSAWIDDVSGVALRHITFLCRDMICECNKCTTGCTATSDSRHCDACLMEYNASYEISGSFAEGCTIPTFFVRYELNEEFKKCSDYDVMVDDEELRRVGFNTEIENNIFATIETVNCSPGYLRLRVARNGEIFRMSKKFLNEQFRIQHKTFEDACYSVFKPTFTLGPAITLEHKAGIKANMDEVSYFSCSSWPPIAQSWVDRERQNKWPSKEIIKEIVSKGCRIVHKAHPSSRDPDAEFRFSFSEAELILFNTLSVDQKKCLIAFKSLVKYGVCTSEIITKKDIDLSSYHLKTIFLWSCETIPADQWHTTNAWARCLLYMIDQLYAFLKSKTLPGYFIPECNLMDSIEPSQTLFQEIIRLRSNPILYIARFLDSTRFLRHSYFKMSEYSQDFREIHLTEEIALQRQLVFLQTILIKVDSNRRVVFWKKEAVLRIFAKWCQQNSHEIHLTPWQCLTKEMTLFDVVHLDIVHGFEVPNNVLLEYVDLEWSVEVVCKLACCYSMETLKREDPKNKIEHSFHLKALLMIHHAMNHKYPSSETIITCASILMRCKEYEMAAQVLESAFSECLHETRFIRCRELYVDLFSHKMKNEILEMFDRLSARGNCDEMLQIDIIFIRFLIFLCYTHTGDEEKREFEMTLMSDFSVSCLYSGTGDSFLHFASFLLMLEVFENSEKWKNLHYQIYERFVSIKIKLLGLTSNCLKDVMISISPGKSPYSLCSCNSRMMLKLITFFNFSQIYSGFLAKTLDTHEYGLSCEIVTTADVIYFSQLLFFRRKLERAISLLEAIVEQEGDFSTSVVIWPKQLHYLVDGNLRRELIKSSEDYVVFPTNLYARYLLSIAYRSLGQEENRINNLAELIVLQDRYARIREFAPMLRIMSAVS